MDKELLELMEKEPTWRLMELLLQVVTDRVDDESVERMKDDRNVDDDSLLLYVLLKKVM